MLNSNQNQMKSYSVFWSTSALMFSSSDEVCLAAIEGTRQRQPSTTSPGPPKNDCFDFAAA
jgi:hypothetical protein